MSIELGKQPLKIIHPCFGRAGSRSLAKALTILGFGPCWHMAENSLSLSNKGIKWWINNDMDNKMYNNTMTSKDTDGWLNHIKCNTIMDAPTCVCWNQFFKFYPNCKVIITIRDYDKMQKSQQKVLKNTIYVWWFDILTYFQFIFGCTPNWVRNSFLPNSLRLDGFQSFDYFINKCDKNEFKRLIDKKIELVKSVVPKEQLLIYNIKDGWEPLCKFLNVEIPKQIAFPHRNKGTQMSKEVFQTLYDGIYPSVRKYLFFNILVLIIALLVYVNCYN